MKIGILGNGSIGCATAIYLAEAGHNVTLFGNKLREGSASKAAGAMLNVFGELEYGQLENEPLRKKFESFGFKVLEIDGHSRKDIYLSLKKAMNYKLKPTILICHTIKGKGVKFMENNPSWHYKSKINNEELKKLQEYFK